MTKAEVGRSFRRLTLEGLWGNRNLDIPLTGPTATTLVAGVNGCGKTTILRLVRALFNRKFYELLQVDFTQLHVELDIARVTVKRKVTNLPPEEESERAVSRMIRRGAAKTKASTDAPALVKTFVLEIEVNQGEKKDTILFPISVVRWAQNIERVSEVRMVGPDLWEDPTGRRYNCDQLVETYGDSDASRSLTFEDELPQWLSTLLQPTRVQFIETQRLNRRGVVPDEQILRRHRPWLRDDSEPRKAVEACAASMRHLIQGFVRAFAERSQKLDQSFAARVLDRTTPANDSQLELREKYDKIKKHQDILAWMGLIQPVNIPEFPDTRDLSDDEKRIIGVYVHDMSEKLSIFEPLRLRADAFLGTLNSLLNDKKVTLDTSDQGGIAIHSSDKRQLRLTALSSGEQHLLVLFHDLIFCTDEHPALIMIDEPEISLHIQWQYRFVDALERAAALTTSQIIVATHSPAIANGRPIIALSHFDEVDETEEDSVP
jgi:predicted ATPase